MTRIEELEKIIEKNDALYWENGISEISDEEYDKYVNELKEIDPNNSLINKINGTNLGKNKVYHKIPMLSLDKVYSKEELFKWMNKVAQTDSEEFLVQPKYDGISGKYEENILSTRGNGEIGENITNKLPIVNFETNKEDTSFILGEILIKINDFANIFSKIISPSTKKCYKNPRNATAGIMGTDDISFFKEQGAKLTFVDYDLYSYTLKLNEFDSKWEKIEKEILELPYPMDGIVIKIKDKKYGDSLGNTAHHPRSAIAFKFTNPKKETKLIDVEWSFGKGSLTPVAIFEPIDLDGITITRASLANYENLKKLNICIGDYVTVERAGRVIPHVISVRKSNDLNTKNPFIDKCPCCGSHLVVASPEIYCPNKNCFEKQKRRLLFSLRSIGIEGIGLPTIEKIMKSSNIKNLYDFVNISMVQLNDCGFGEITVKNIFNEIQAHRNIKDYQYITSLNIEDVGNEIAKNILNEISLDNLIKCTSVGDLTKIRGVGSVTAEKIIGYFKNNYEYAIKLLSCFFIEKTEKTDNNTKTVCFTGAMEQPRKYYEEIAREKGIVPISNVTSSLTYLVVSDMNSTSSKMKKAQKYGIKILSVDEFMNL